MSERVILHSDLNNFFASVETLINPDLQGKYVAVCGDPTLRHGIVLAKNEFAKKMGVKTGMTIREAMQRCPNLVVTIPHPDEYRKIAAKVRRIYADYTDQVESFGIDEAWLDVTHSGVFGSGKQIADDIR
ncbi:MAG: DNA polymerase IV, partial [Clostridia bacterium]|nr:DNA polymerase IV [Clostridia bacterium]